MYIYIYQLQFRKSIQHPPGFHFRCSLPWFWWPFSSRPPWIQGLSQGMKAFRRSPPWERRERPELHGKKSEEKKIEWQLSLMEEWRMTSVSYNFSTLMSTKCSKSGRWSNDAGPLDFGSSQELEQQMDLRGVPRHRFLLLGEIPGGGTTFGTNMGTVWDRNGRSFMAFPIDGFCMVLSGPRHSSNLSKTQRAKSLHVWNVYQRSPNISDSFM